MTKRKAQRKIVQIAVGPDTALDRVVPAVVALADDGSAWILDTGNPDANWKRLRSLPQDER